jgi:hypothetical protein
MPGARSGGGNRGRGGLSGGSGWTIGTFAFGTETHSSMKTTTKSDVHALYGSGPVRRTQNLLYASATNEWTATSASHHTHYVFQTIPVFNTARRASESSIRRTPAPDSNIVFVVKKKNPTSNQLQPPLPPMYIHIPSLSCHLDA